MVLHSPPAGADYHRAAAACAQRWWVPPLALSTAALLWLAVGAALMFGGVVVFLGVSLLFDGDLGDPAAPASPLFGHPVAALAMQLLLLSAMIPIVFLVVRVVQRRRPGTLSSVAGRLRWGWLLWCFAASLPAVFLAIGMPVLLAAVTEFGPDPAGAFVGIEEFLLAMVVILALVPLQATAEEYGLRGFVMQTLGSYTVTPWLGIVVSTALFTVMHFSYTAWAIADVALFGAAIAWLVWRTGGLEAGIALHVLHNLTAFTITAWEGTLLDLETGGSWQGFLGTVVEVGLFCVIVVWLADRIGIRRTFPDPYHQPQDPYHQPQG